ncbi:Hsp20/alpha crystallin family protein [Halomonas sp. BDJS001]|uniref:Hsp20/alpha crystallin family protein n=1 Tax=Halomonas sp. BDJS001 TaxID=2992143 RepID=UPI0022364F2C|nr:Hsp20/alpha crystallin family protein [Halomonas sp. BDJS001]UZH11559.1 Hsp20/alpha crystallin family protein [Halomonas sp. BDJS001]
MQGSFSRTVALPAEVDAQNADAKFKDGILTITLPKEKKTSRRKLDVKLAS